MPILERYLLRLFALRFAGVLGLLVVMLQLENYTRVARVLEHAPGPLALLGKFSLYLLPEYLGLSLLVALFLGIAMGVRAAALTSEWQIFHAAGVSPLRLALLPVLLGCTCALAEAAIQFELKPRGEDLADHLSEDLRLGKLGIGGEVGAFVDLGNGATLRMGSFEAASGKLGNVFLSQGPTVLVAREGQAGFDRFGNLQLLLRDGQAFTRGAGGGTRGGMRSGADGRTGVARQVKDRRLGFGELELVVPLGPELSKAGVQQVELDRLTLPQLLLRAAIERATRQAERPALAAIAARLAFVWALLLLPFVGQVLGAPRLRGRTGFGIGLGIVLIVGFLKLVDFLRGVMLGAPLISFGAAMLALTLGTWLLWRGESRYGIGYVEAALDDWLGRRLGGWIRKMLPKRTATT